MDQRKKQVSATERGSERQEKTDRFTFMCGFHSQRHWPNSPSLVLLGPSCAGCGCNDRHDKS